MDYIEVARQFYTDCLYDSRLSEKIKELYTNFLKANNLELFNPLMIVDISILFCEMNYSWCDLDMFASLYKSKRITRLIASAKNNKFLPVFETAIKHSILNNVTYNCLQIAYCYTNGYTNIYDELTEWISVNKKDSYKKFQYAELNL